MTEADERISLILSLTQGTAIIANLGVIATLLLTQLAPVDKDHEAELYAQLNGLVERCLEEGKKVTRLAMNYAEILKGEGEKERGN